MPPKLKCLQCLTQIDCSLLSVLFFCRITAPEMSGGHHGTLAEQAIFCL